MDKILIQILEFNLRAEKRKNNMAVGGGNWKLKIRVFSRKLPV